MNLSLLSEVVTLLAEEEKLPEKYRDHSLTGPMKEYRKCHILPDWLLIYRIDSDELLLMLFRTGSHKKEGSKPSWFGTLFVLCQINTEAWKALQELLLQEVPQQLLPL